jgi:hypothetical protein
MHSIVFYVFLASNPRMLQLTLLLPLPLWIVRRQSPKVPNKMVQGLWAYFTSTLCSAAHSTHPRIIHQGPPSMLDALCFANRNFLWYLMLAASRLICGESLRVIQAIWSQKYFTPREVFVEQLNTTMHCTCFKRQFLRIMLITSGSFKIAKEACDYIEDLFKGNTSIQSSIYLSSNNTSTS